MFGWFVPLFVGCWLAGCLVVCLLVGLFPCLLAAGWLVVWLVAGLSVCLLVGWSFVWVVSSLVGWLVCLFVGCLAGCMLVGSVTGCFFDWLVVWLVCCQFVRLVGHSSIKTVNSALCHLPSPTKHASPPCPYIPPVPAAPHPPPDAHYLQSRTSTSSTLPHFLQFPHVEHKLPYTITSTAAYTCTNTPDGTIPPRAVHTGSADLVILSEIFLKSVLQHSFLQLSEQ